MSNWVPVRERLPQVGEWQFDPVSPDEGWHVSDCVPVLLGSETESWAEYRGTTSDGGKNLNSSGGWEIWGKYESKGGVAHWFGLQISQGLGNDVYKSLPKDGKRGVHPRHH
jgi:hypothetical protein